MSDQFWKPDYEVKFTNKHVDDIWWCKVNLVGTQIALLVVLVLYAWTTDQLQEQITEIKKHAHTQEDKQ